MSKKIPLFLVSMGALFASYFVSKQIFMYVFTAIVCMYVLFWYEGKTVSARKIVLLSIMVSLSVFARTIFFFIPGFSPMPAFIILSGIYLGPEFGLMIGLLSPLISNMIFGQGPWAPFQMFSLGLIGLLAGLCKQAQFNKFFRVLLGAFAAILFSTVMDIWTVLSIDGLFTWSRYLMVLVPSAPFMVIYIISNVLFLLLLGEPFGRRLLRIVDKYEISNKIRSE